MIQTSRALDADFVKNEKHFAHKLAASFRAKELSIVSYLEGLFSHIDSHNKELNALTQVEREYALQRAKELDARGCKPGESLFGVPFIIKENIQKRGFSVACGSKILSGYKGQFDSFVVRKLEEAGAIPIASANMDEFAMGSSNEHSVHGPVLNPHDLSRVSGGSSGGPAAACSAGFSPFSLGSDTGGSVREPAAFCGIYGFKPTYGRVSRYGLVAYASSFDQISPFARSSDDLDLIMNILGQHDEEDETSLLQNYSALDGFSQLKGLKVGIIKDLFSTGMDDSVLSAFEHMKEQLVRLGAELVDVEVKGIKASLAVYYTLACSEASSNLARFDGIRYGYRAQESEDLHDLYCRTRSEGFGAEVKRRIMLGTFALSAGYAKDYYHKAQNIRDILKKNFAKAFREVSVILTPTAPTPAFRLGEHMQDPLAMYLNDIFTIPVNIAGLPALSVPCRIASPLPVGLQFIGPKNSDKFLIQLSKHLEQNDIVGVL